MNPDGVLLSNGPGDPAGVPYAVEMVRVLLGRVPVFGICLGHQIMGQAFGGRTYRLKFGHHGGNQPVKHLPTGRVEISAHNHNFAVDPDTLPPEIEVTHVNLNDGCNEGMRHRTLPALSIQYHPEAAPGPHDADPLFAEFVAMMAALVDV
jgi:carbamoyl-phosphate synthase small subunit